MAYEFKATPEFWKAFHRLNSEQQALATAAFKKFRANPFDPALKPHKINRLTSLARHPVLAVSVAGDLRVVFTVRGNHIISLDIGTHDIYG